MNDTQKEIRSEATRDAGGKTGCSSSCSASSCGSHSSLLIVAAAALLLAGYAAFTGQQQIDNSATDARIAAMESEIAQLRGQIESLGNDVASNRESLIQTKIQRALTSIEEIGDIAGQETRATIAEVEKMLRGLTASDETAATIEVAAPAEVPSAEAVSPEAQTETPATEKAPPHDNSDMTDTPAETAPTEATPPAAEAPVTAEPSGAQAF